MWRPVIRLPLLGRSTSSLVQSEAAFRGNEGTNCFVFSLDNTPSSSSSSSLSFSSSSCYLQRRNASSFVGGAGFRNWRSGHSQCDSSDYSPTHSGHLKSTQRVAWKNKGGRFNKKEDRYNKKRDWRSGSQPVVPFVAPKRRFGQDSELSEKEGVLTFSRDGEATDDLLIPEPPGEEETTSLVPRRLTNSPPSTTDSLAAVAPKKKKPSVSEQQALELKRKMDASRTRSPFASTYNNSPQLSQVTDSARTSISRVFCPYCDANFTDSFEGRLEMRQHIRAHHWNPVAPRSRRRRKVVENSTAPLLPLFSDSLLPPSSSTTGELGSGVLNVPCNTPVVACQNCGGVFSNFETFYRHLDPKRAFQCRTIQHEEGYDCPYCDDDDDDHHHKKRIQEEIDDKLGQKSSEGEDDMAIPLPPDEEDDDGRTSSLVSPSSRPPPQFPKGQLISAVMNHFREKHWGGYFKLPEGAPSFQCVGCFGQFRDFDVFWNHLNTTYFTPAPTFHEKINPVVSQIGKILAQQQQQQQPGRLLPDGKFSPSNNTSKGITSSDNLLLDNRRAATAASNKLFDCLRIGTDVDCGVCTRLFRKDETIYAARRHYEEHFNEKRRTRKDPFVCSKCGDEFTDFEKFANHVDWYNGLKCKTLGKPIRCPYCDQLFDSNKGIGAVRKHMLEKHWKAPEHRVRDPPFTCNKCNTEFKTFNQLMWHFDFRNDLKCKATGMVKALTCPICPKGTTSFKDEQEAKNHLLEHHWRGDLIQREPAFECQACGREFTEFSDYVDHFDWKRRGMNCDGGRARRDEEEEEREEAARASGNDSRAKREEPEGRKTIDPTKGKKDPLSAQWTRTELANGQVIFEESPSAASSGKEEKNSSVINFPTPALHLPSSVENPNGKKKSSKYSQTNRRLNITNSSALLLNNPLERVTLLHDDEQPSSHMGVSARDLKSGDSGKGTAEDKEVALIIPDGLSYLPLVPFECPYCPEFESPEFEAGAKGLEDFIRHYERVHWDKVNPLDSGQKHVCNMCGEGFWSHDHFQAHLSLRYGVRCRTLGFSVQCPFCPHKFKPTDSRMTVRDHLKHHHWNGAMWNRKYPFVCVCGAQFVNFLDFWRHFSWKDGGMDCSTPENQWTCTI